jgi:glycosyltransferase involved in cell wall biosynthesis
MIDQSSPRIGIDARFVIGSDHHPHGALLRELLWHNFTEQHPFHYLLFHNEENLLPWYWLNCPNVTFIFVDNGQCGERWGYWRHFDPAVRSARLNLFVSPFYRFPLGAWLAGIPMLHMIHDVSQLTVDPQLLPARFRSRWKRLQILIGFSLYARLARRTVTVSSHAAAEISRVLHLSHTRIIVIPNCYLMAQAMHAPALLVQGSYLLFIGADMPKKNLRGLLAAWPMIQLRFPEVQLVLRSNDSLGHVSRAKGVVLLDEYLDREELDELILNARALVLPSFHEGFGLPVLEALAMGTPVCVSEGTALEEVAADAAVLFDPSSPESIAAACCSVLSFTPQQRKQQRQRCIDRAAHFVPSCVLPSLLQLMHRTAL